MILGPNDPAHGTRNGYSNHKCRCDRCRRAWADYVREYYHRTGRSRMTWEQYVKAFTKHGVTRYKKGCHCDVCREAVAAQKRRQRARHHAYYKEYERARYQKRKAA